MNVYFDENITKYDYIIDEWKFDTPKSVVGIVRNWRRGADIKLTAGWTTNQFDMNTRTFVTNTGNVIKLGTPAP